MTAIRALGRRARRNGIEIAAFATVLAVAVAVRVVRLGGTPRILTGDELENLRIAVRLNEGTGPGVFGFDWAGRPALTLYPLAWIVRIFGDSVADFRMFPVIISLLIIVLFYVVARELMRPAAALAAMMLLATNLWFLNFSRTGWDNIDAALFAVGACWTTTRALKAPGRVAFAWWAGSGLFVAAGLYGYFSGHLIFLSVTLIAVIATAAGEAPWRRTLAGLVLAGVLSAGLFAPMARNIALHWDYYTSRTNVVSVFHTKRPDGTTRNGWGVAKDNVIPNYRGLVLQEGGVLQRGPYNARYHPNRQAALDLIATHLFWVGLVLAALSWRRTYAWFTFFVPLLIAEVFSGDTPDMGRAIIIAPFYFLFIGWTFDRILSLSRRPLWYGAALAGITATVALVSVREVDGYFDWQGQEATQLQRMPGIDGCEYNLWWTGIVDAARRSAAVDVAKFDQQRRELNCSPIVAKALGLPDPSTAAAPAPNPMDRDARRLTDLDNVSQALRRYYQENGKYPSTDALVQSLCGRPRDDAGCRLAQYMGALPRDPNGDGYWYQSDGASFVVYARLEAGDRTCKDVPSVLTPAASTMYCVSSSLPG